jgi:hypothetical protein
MWRVCRSGPVERRGERLCDGLGVVLELAMGEAQHAVARSREDRIAVTVNF